MSKNLLEFFPRGLNLFKDFKRFCGIILPGMLLLFFLGTLGAGSVKMEEEIQVTGRIYVRAGFCFALLHHQSARR
jgi:hypothetical protein